MIPLGTVSLGLACGSIIRFRGNDTFGGRLYSTSADASNLVQCIGLANSNNVSRCFRHLQPVISCHPPRQNSVMTATCSSIFVFRSKFNMWCLTTLSLCFPSFTVSFGIPWATTLCSHPMQHRRSFAHYLAAGSSEAGLALLYQPCVYFGVFHYRVGRPFYFLGSYVCASALHLYKPLFIRLLFYPSFTFIFCLCPF